MPNITASSASENWIRCSKELKCPKCGDANTWCSVSADGQAIKCRRVSDGAFKTKNDDGGSAYFHRANPAERTHSAPSKNSATPSAKTTKQGGDAVPALADAETRHAVYSALLEAIPSQWLNDVRDDLHRRGLTDEEIQRRGYKFVRGKGKPAAVIEHDVLVPLVTRFGAEVLRSIPGLYFDGEHPQLAATGLFIPVRDVQGRIFAIKVRSCSKHAKSKYFWLSSTKHGGPGPGCPAHVPLGIEGNCETVWITEGELKCDVTHSLAGYPIVSAPGVTNWRTAIEAAKELGAKTVVLAFDADQWTNPNVAHAVRECYANCESDGLTVQLTQWPEEAGKGIDDVLASGRETDIKFVSGANAHAIIEALSEIAEASGGDGPSNEAPDDPHRLARIVIAQCGSTEEGGRTIAYWQGECWRWDGCSYQRVPADEFAAEMATLIKAEFDRINRNEMEQPRDESEPPPKTKKVTKTLVGNVENAIRSLCTLLARRTQPSWLIDNPPFDANEVFVTRSAMIHLPSLVRGDASVLEPTPQFFSSCAVDYDFDPDAECPVWLNFLGFIWGDDPESINALQEWFGYFLLLDASQQKILLLIGPSRSGKGTIGRVLKGLIGERNIASPTLNSLTTQYDLWPLVGKSVAILPDARITKSTDAIAVTERLLSISGQDPQDIHRKFLTTLTGVKLPVRFMVMSNELPSLRDPSGAVAKRLILLRMKHSALGQEDIRLSDKLTTELPGILNWAIAGWQRLQERGHFTQPASGDELVSEFEDLSSPIKQFLADCCVIDPECSVAIKDLFDAWKCWCDEHGRQHQGTRETFGKELRAAVPGLSKSRPRSTGERVYRYFGVGLNAEN